MSPKLPHAVMIVILAMTTTPTTRADVQGQIYGGSPVRPNEFRSITLSPYCGGSLVADDMVLTTAACEKEMNDYGGVHIGGTDAFATDKIKIVKTIPHPNYGWGDYGYPVNDLMLVKLACTKKKPIQVLDFSADVPKVNSSVIAIGFGEDESGKPTDKLLKTTLKVVDRDICQDIYEGALDEPAKVICAYEKGRDWCGRDRGGPLYSTHKGKPKAQVGLASSGNGCALEPYPGIYTRLSSHKKWIKDTIRKHSNPKVPHCDEK